MFGFSSKDILTAMAAVTLAIFSPVAILVALACLTYGPLYYWAAALLLLVPGLFPLLVMKKKKKIYLLVLCGTVLALLLTSGIANGIKRYEDSFIIDTSPNINLQEYLPFDENSKIVKLDGSLSLTEDLPVVDGAAAVFPVYSAFVNAVYPHTVALNDGVFEYNNTVVGYEKLAEKETDIFFGAKPSEEQVAYAEEQGTTFTYTQIGWEAFVFFVHKDNPVDSLTVEEIKGIYSGKITNWKEVGGHDEEIVAYQRNEGSGSQSMMLRFMDGTPLMEPDKKEVVGFMGGIIEKVADYKSRSESIGFSFRYYVEGIIRNPEIKVIAVDGVAATKENVGNGSYPIVTPLYAVTYAGNENENVDRLLEWVLSEEGQYIIEETGYVGLGNKRE